MVKAKRKLLNREPFSRPRLKQEMVHISSGCFYILVSKSKSYKTGASVQLQFSITQDSREIGLISFFKDFLKCGFIKIQKKQPCGVFIVRKFSDIQNIIIPLLQNNPLQGAKLQDYLDRHCFAQQVKVMEIMENKAHLTPTSAPACVRVPGQGEGLEKKLKMV